ncbi:hypothetical protein E2C01_078952 [Portunus trituberculatus]|uniref:Uncharacterized protein n=1 Tax=Portunus trituberculatus TaxID=210409 RepID=A0A5B7IPC0_PORTR|nr:hypothetical protein [Portunus trituberculatus]
MVVAVVEVEIRIISSIRHWWYLCRQEGGGVSCGGRDRCGGSSGSLCGSEEGRGGGGEVTQVDGGVDGNRLRSREAASSYLKVRLRSPWCSWGLRDNIYTERTRREGQGEECMG